MTNKEKKDWLSVQYPLTVICDRYDGTYSGAKWLAFPLDYDKIPSDVDASDPECAQFWKNYKEPVGKGAYASVAVVDLIQQMRKFEPEESEDERIRKEIISALKFANDGGVYDKHIAYLEKQEEQKPDSLTKYVYSKEDKKFIQDCANILVANDYAPSAERLLSMFEQKSAEWSEEDEKMRLETIRVLESGCERYIKESGCLPSWYIVMTWLKSLPLNLKKKNEDVAKLCSNGWSEEDERVIRDACNWIAEYAGFLMSENKDKAEMLWKLSNKLKSLRPQPRKEIFQAAKHDLAIKFMNYLDENRPEGKMSLSNGECEDIDKAFRENNWAKILRYAYYNWKPSDVCYGAKGGPDPAGVWKPSEEQMEALKSAVKLYKDTHYEIYHERIVSLYDHLKKLM